MVANLTIYQKKVLRDKAKKVSSGKLNKGSKENVNKSPEKNELYKREVLRKSRSAKSPQEQSQKGVLRKIELPFRCECSVSFTMNGHAHYDCA